MARLVIAHVPEDVADIVGAVLQKASRAAIRHEVAASLSNIADGVRDGVNVDHEYHVAVGFSDGGKPLRIPADGIIPCEPVFLGSAPAERA